MEKRVVINGINIEYWIKGNGMPLLFLHGSFGSFRFYLPVLKILAKKYRVIAPTFPGMGKSQSSKGQLNLNIYKTIAMYFIKHMIKDAKFIFMGHSLGGSLVLMLNQEFDLNNTQLILLNPGGDRIKYYFIRTFIGWTSLIYLHLKNIRNLKLAQIIPWDAVNIIFRRPIDLLKLIGLIKRLTFELKPLISKRIEKITIFTALDDHYVTPCHAERIHRFIPESEIVYVKQGGHAWFIYDNEPLMRFFKSQD